MLTRMYPPISWLPIKMGMFRRSLGSPRMWICIINGVKGEAGLQIARTLLSVSEVDRLQTSSLCAFDVRGMIVHEDRSFSRKPVMGQKILKDRTPRLHHPDIARYHDAEKSVPKIITLAHMREHGNWHVGEAVKWHTAFAQRPKHSNRVRLHDEGFSHGVKEQGQFRQAPSSPVLHAR